MEQEKRLTKTDFIIVYFIIFSLVAFVGGFFLGASTIKKNMLEEMSALKEQEEKAKAMENVSEPYPPTDFVSFYHGVYLPYDKLRSDHYTYLRNLLRQQSGADHNIIDLDMKSRAEETLSAIRRSGQFVHSPLLQDARSLYIKSVEAYIDGIATLFHDQENVKNELAKNHLFDLENDSPSQRYWLQAQSRFYQAIAHWEALQKQVELPVEKLDQINDIAEWSKLTFQQKNFVIAKKMETMMLAAPYNPEDITIHLDSAIQTGNGSLLNSLEEGIRMMHVTNAVKKGDFLQEKHIFYSEIESPLLPLFNN